MSLSHEVTPRIWVKVCGTTTLADAQLAVEAGADALGFVFAKSPRQVTPEQAAEIVTAVRADVEKIGVFVDASFEEICAAVRRCGLTGVQLHSDAAPDLPERIHAALGSAIRILRVVHFGAEALQQVKSYGADPHVGAVLVDSRTASAVGGTGTRFDWAAARQSVFAGQSGKLIVAGGLTPENVAEAIATLKPRGVDVVSGVEATPGRKDAAKVRAFVARARNAV